ncbi:MAG TPA: hypothetical protein VNX27_00510 [Chthoniobacterales bacterium]|jgi:hypothetical protein|nr:hypothetical protein [Chthoniobacterales bacterium]
MKTLLIGSLLVVAVAKISVAAPIHIVVPGDPQQHFNAAGLHVLALKILPVLEKLLVAKH